MVGDSTSVSSLSSLDLPNKINKCECMLSFRTNHRFPEGPFIIENGAKADRRRLKSPLTKTVKEEFIQ